MRRLIGVEAEIIQRAPANRVGILVLRKSFAVPCQRIGTLGRIPRCAAISLIILRAIVCPARLLRRGVKSEVGHVDSGSQRHTEGLDGAIEVFVIERVLIMPDTS